MIKCDRSKPLHYFDDVVGQHFPSVSQILDTLYGDRFAYVKPDVLAEAQARGTRRHLLFGVLVLRRAGLAPDPIIDPCDEAAARGLVKWIETHQVWPIQVEEPRVNEQYGYAGTPDLLCLYGRERKVLLVDLKTGIQDDAHKVQVQAYWRLMDYAGATVLMDLYVDDAGQVRESVVVPSPHDWSWFLSGLGVLKGRLARGVKGGWRYEVRE